MKFFESVCNLAARLAAVHAEAHKALRLPAPRFANGAKEADCDRLSFWILHAR